MYWTAERFATMLNGNFSIPWPCFCGESNCAATLVGSNGAVWGSGISEKAFCIARTGFRRRVGRGLPLLRIVPDCETREGDSKKTFTVEKEMFMGARSALALCLVILLVGGWTPCAWGQAGSTLAQLNGTVTDQNGGPVPKATLTLKDTNTGATYTAVADDNGFYVFPNARNGRYDLTIEARGFSKYSQTGIVLTVSQVATIPIVLKLATVAEKIEVTTETPQIEPTRTEDSQVIDTRQIQDLPSADVYLRILRC
jgi:Carboxypeptidase regulatory-like domain